jgi:hypothetical protein
MFSYKQRSYAVGGGMPQGSPAAAPQEGIDVEGQIRQGVEAFMQSQDPAIAVEVVTMLAEMMGIAPQLDPYAQQAEQMAPAPAPAGGGVPMGSSGMRFYRKGGVIKRYKKGGKINKYEHGGPHDNDPVGQESANRYLKDYRADLEKADALRDFLSMSRDEWSNSQSLPDDHPWYKVTRDVRQSIGDAFDKNPDLDGVDAGFLRYGAVTKDLARKIGDIGYDPLRSSGTITGNFRYKQKAEMSNPQTSELPPVLFSTPNPPIPKTRPSDPATRIATNPISRSDMDKMRQSYYKNKKR